MRRSGMTSRHVSVTQQVSTCVPDEEALLPVCGKTYRRIMPDTSSQVAPEGRFGQ
jgi:hypothetical protein